ncbi:Pachytene checkpoint protein 2 [Orbilia oligospora]|uniref:Pachytene checkpoint protein 2 n=1 Tax=Orbilia oligospora TaxID=2813651 RepID=A0A7C8K1K3_ORBOL|nr:Pachytene checkpoint protein 2 [Orbilia oligospora]TGJ70822.1 Pachytene checkpoint protein 2 [Orbilia oligospora]
MAEKIMSVTIEACLKSDYTGPLRDAIPALRELVTGNYDTLSKGQVIDGGDIIGTLAEKIERLDVSDTSETKGFEGVATSTARIRVHPYKYFKSLPQTIKIPMENETGDCCPTVLMHELPSVQLAASWDQLFFEPDIKPNLLRFVTSILSFADRGVSLDCVSWNRIILLHGSAGSGKTTLCRALAQKIAMRSFSKFNRTILLEINTKTVLSRWFTESSKLVDALFDWIHTQTSSAPDHFFFIMIDEVESIASSRKAAASANEPADAIRIVNSLLTSLDRLKCRRNILILTTSNLLEVIDTAFLDRVDLCQHVSAPSVVATYSILLSCMQELIRCGIIILENEEALYDYKMASVFKNVRPDLPSSKLLCIVEQAKGLSGRALRRIPLLMHATSVEDESMSLSSALDAMRLVVEAEQSSARLAVVTDREANLTAKVLTDQHYYL